jgi:hypothetical protein
MKKFTSVLLIALLFSVLTPNLALSAAEPASQNSALFPSAVTGLTAACTNKAELVRNLSISDKSVLKANIFYTKAWRIMNSGTCEWTTDYKLVFQNGSQMLAPAELSLKEPVKPGETIDIYVPFLTPSVAGTFSSEWMLQDKDGKLFGFGGLADTPLKISIVITLVEVQRLDRLGRKCG